MKQAVLSIDYAHIHELQVQDEGHKILNQEEWLTKSVNKNSLDLFKATYYSFCELIGTNASFDLEFWTVILNVYYNRGYHAGFRYGCIVATTQFGNTATSKTWLEIGLTIPQYGLCKFLE